MLRMFTKRSEGRGRSGPLDRYISTKATNAFTIDPDSAVYTFMAGWGWGSDVGAMLTNIRTESPFSLVGGAYLYQPTLQVFGYTTIDFVAAGNVSVHVELIVCTPGVGRTGTGTLATIGTTFNNAWAQSYDARPTGYEYFPDTSILENSAFFNSQITKFIPTKRLSFVVPVGKPKRIILKFRTRKFRYAEYSQSTFLTEGQVGGKSYMYILKTRGERGQVCGVKSAVNQPILTELGSPFMMKQRDHYFYKWIAGNNRPTIYGSNLGTNESVSEEARQWTGVYALKAQRFAAATDTSVGFNDWGGTDVYSKHEVNINPIYDCTEGPFYPAVTAPP